MSEEYPRKIAQIVAAEMLQSKNIEGVQKSSLEVLEDLLLRYLTELGRQSHKNAEIARRTVCNPTDVVCSHSFFLGHVCGRTNTNPVLFSLP